MIKAIRVFLIFIGCFSLAYGSEISIGNYSKIKIYEFFDYQCIHCRKMAPILSKVVEKNNAELILKPVPIINNKSIAQAAGIVVANRMISKNQIEKIHLLLMRGMGTDDAIRRLGINEPIGFQMQMHQLWVKDFIDKNVSFLNRHGGRIPLFIIQKGKNNIVFVGERSEKQINHMIGGL